jgi:hypothetical protein
VHPAAATGRSARLLGRLCGAGAMIAFAVPVTRKYAGVPGMRHRGLESE